MSWFGKPHGPGSSLGKRPSKATKLGWALRGRYSRHSDAMQPKLKDFPKLQASIAKAKREGRWPPK
jgi:hypothetical protein